MEPAHQYPACCAPATAGWPWARSSGPPASSGASGVWPAGPRGARAPLAAPRRAWPPSTLVDAPCGQPMGGELLVAAGWFWRGGEASGEVGSRLSRDRSSGELRLAQGETALGGSACCVVLLKTHSCVSWQAVWCLGDFTLGGYGNPSRWHGVDVDAGGVRGTLFASDHGGAPSEVQWFSPPVPGRLSPPRRPSQEARRHNSGSQARRELPSGAQRAPTGLR